MQSIYNFIVSPYNKRNTAEKDIDGKKLLLNTELQNHQYTSRHGVIKSVPKVNDLNIQVGDEIIVHHNVFRRFRDIRGDEKNSKSYYEEDLFFVYPDQIFAFKREKEWEPVKGYVFVKPLKNNNMFSLEHEKSFVGKVQFDCANYKAGEIIGFVPGMEYEFNIDEHRLYRIPAHRITIKYGYQGNEKEYNPSWTQSG